MVEHKEVFLNLGSHNKKIEGYVNVDVLELPGVDIVWDLTEIPYKFNGERVDDDTIDGILSQEFLEHISFRKAYPVLMEWYRILKHGSKIKIQVPDIGLMCEYYANNQICDCVPRKAAKYEDYKADPHCFTCSGKAMVHPERWAFALSGAQKHEFDAHLNHFNQSKMEKLLIGVGFHSVVFTPNIYKIIVEAEK